MSIDGSASSRTAKPLFRTLISTSLATAHSSVSATCKRIGLKAPSRVYSHSSSAAGCVSCVPWQTNNAVFHTFNVSSMCSSRDITAILNFTKQLLLFQRKNDFRHNLSGYAWTVCVSSNRKNLTGKLSTCLIQVRWHPVCRYQDPCVQHNKQLISIWSDRPVLASEKSWPCPLGHFVGAT